MSSGTSAAVGHRKDEMVWLTQGVVLATCGKAARALNAVGSVQDCTTQGRLCTWVFPEKLVCMAGI